MEHSEELTITRLLKQRWLPCHFAHSLSHRRLLSQKSRAVLGTLGFHKWIFVDFELAHHACVRTCVGGRTVCTQVCTKVCAFPSSQTILKISDCWLIDVSLIQFCQLRRTLPVSLTLITVLHSISLTPAIVPHCSARKSEQKNSDWIQHVAVIRPWIAHVRLSLIDFKRGGIKCLIFLSVT